MAIWPASVLRKHAVVAVPHGYSPAMRGAVEAAGQAADLELRLIDEHVAAAKAYGMDAEHQVVYDLGGRACQVLWYRVQALFWRMMEDLAYGFEGF